MIICSNFCLCSPFTGIYLKVLIIIFGVTSFVAAAVNMLLPDTRDSKLPDLISETKPIRRYVRVHVCVIFKVAVKNKSNLCLLSRVSAVYKERSSLSGHSCCFHKEDTTQQNNVQEKVWRDEPRLPSENNFGILAKLQQWKCKLFTFTWLKLTWCCFIADKPKAVSQFTALELLLLLLLPLYVLKTHRNTWVENSADSPFAKCMI